VIRSARSLDADLALRAEACVIGSGAGGAVAAAELAAAGRDVVVLEAGPHWTSRDFTQREDDMLPRLFEEAGMRQTADGAITVLQGRCIGGSTVHNLCYCFRTPDPILALWRDEHALPVHAVRDDAAERRQEEDRHLAGEPDEPEQRGGSGQPVDQPRLRDHLHPGADERDELPGEEEAVVSMREGAETGWESHASVSRELAGSFGTSRYASAVRSKRRVGVADRQALPLRADCHSTALSPRARDRHDGEPIVDNGGCQRGTPQWA